MTIATTKPQPTALTVRAHGLQPIDHRPERPIERQLQLHLGHVDPRRQMVLHLHRAHDPDGDGMMDLDGTAAPSRQRVGVDAKAGQPAVALGQLHHHDGGGEGGRHGGGCGRVPNVVAPTAAAAGRHAVVQRVCVAPRARALANPKSSAPSQRRQHALQRQLELSQIDLKDDDVVRGTFDPVLQEDPPRGAELGKARYPLGPAASSSASASAAVVVRGGGSARRRPAPGGDADVVGIEMDDRPAPAEEDGAGPVDVAGVPAAGCRGGRRV